MKLLFNGVLDPWVKSMTNKKTILQICPRLNSGGIERGTVDVAIALQRAGFNSLVVSGGGYLVDELQRAGVTHISLPVFQKSPLAIRRNSQALHTLILDHQVDLVHARSRAPIWTAYLAMKSLSVPLVTSCHSPHGAGFLGLKKYYNRAITRGQRVIAISNFIADYLQRDYHLASEKCRVIYRGIDLQHYDPHHFNQQQHLQIKNHYHIPTDKKIILLPGRITRWKGQDVLIKALAELNNPQLHAVIVGRVDSDEFYKELKQQIAQFKLASQIQFIDETADLAPLYAVADITLSTSRKAEAFGRVAVEGQAMQTTVIATRLGAAQETVLNKQTGFLIAPDNSTELALMLKHVLTLNVDQTQQLHQAALRHVQAQFDKQLMLRRTQAVYEELL